MALAWGNDKNTRNIPPGNRSVYDIVNENAYTTNPWRKPYKVPVPPAGVVTIKPSGSVGYYEEPRYYVPTVSNDLVPASDYDENWGETARKAFADYNNEQEFIEETERMTELMRRMAEDTRQRQQQEALQQLREQEAELRAQEEELRRRSNYSNYINQQWRESYLPRSQEPTINTSLGTKTAWESYELAKRQNDLATYSMEVAVIFSTVAKIVSIGLERATSDRDVNFYVNFGSPVTNNGTQHDVSIIVRSPLSCNIRLRRKLQGTQLTFAIEVTPRPDTPAEAMELLRIAKERRGKITWTDAKVEDYDVTSEKEKQEARKAVRQRKVTI